MNERRQAIEAVADELCTNADETVSGERLVQLLESTPLEPFQGVDADDQGDELFDSLFGQSTSKDDSLRSLAEIVMGRVSDWDMVPAASLMTKAEQVKAQLLDEETKRRLESMKAFSASGSMTSFPSPF